MKISTNRPSASIRRGSKPSSRRWPRAMPNRPTRPRFPRRRCARSEPRHAKLHALWHSDEATKPGNIIAAEEADGSVLLYVNDGWRTVVAHRRRGTARRPL